MSTMAPAKAAQLALALLMVILMVSGTPVRSLRISAVTSDEGVCVGKGPAVSVGEVVQLPSELVPAFELEIDVVVRPESSFLQALIRGATVPTPKAARKPFFKK